MTRLVFPADLRFIICAEYLGGEPVLNSALLPRPDSTTRREGPKQTTHLHNDLPTYPRNPDHYNHPFPRASAYTVGRVAWVQEDSIPRRHPSRRSSIRMAMRAAARAVNIAM